MQSSESDKMSSPTTTTTATTASSDTAAPKRVALIIGSTRQPRFGPHLARLIHDAIQADGAGVAGVQLDIVDIAAFNLPLFDEPIPPMMVRRGDDYAHAHTRAWSAAVGGYAGFVFLTPQYNWSVPAALKNALDFLFHEWAGKACLLASYGGRGGGRAAAHLRDVATGLRMRPLAAGVEFALGAHEGAQQRAGAGLAWDGAAEAWAPELLKVKELYAELCAQL